MAPTTLLGQKTATTPLGRREKYEGRPLRIPEMLAVLPGVYSLERTSCDSPGQINKAKIAIREAFKNQIDNKGFSLVEVLSMCPTYWGLSAVESLDWIKNVMSKEFPLGKIK